MKKYIDIQNKYYDNAIKELKNGKKETHWMWYFFPQVIGLGESDKSIYYALKSKKEIIDYLNNKTLKDRLLEMCNILLSLNSNDIEDILGYPDNLKLKSSITLFKQFDDNDAYNKILIKYFDGQEDEITLDIIKNIF